MSCSPIFLYDAAASARTGKTLSTPVQTTSPRGIFRPGSDASASVHAWTSRWNIRLTFDVCSYTISDETRRGLDPRRRVAMRRRCRPEVGQEQVR